MLSVDGLHKDVDAASKLVQVLAETFPQLDWQAADICRKFTARSRLVRQTRKSP